jgi:hypothetical protein
MRPGGGVYARVAAPQLPARHRTVSIRPPLRQSLRLKLSEVVALIETRPLSEGGRIAKRALDILGSTAGLIALWPVLLGARDRDRDRREGLSTMQRNTALATTQSCKQDSRSTEIR